MRNKVQRLVALVRRLITYSILLICVLWLLFAYVPSLQALLPTIAFSRNRAWLAILGVIALLIFIAIQLWLVYATVRTVRIHQTKADRPSFRLHLGTEFFWTALPIAMTIALAWASYPLWRQLLQP